ncbi:MAG: hypothetical protein FJ388_13240, partial [Verrucomicrobia bacterium]|nr:hypothetical protein [Verrucomicrobiota bacterium]
MDTPTPSWWDSLFVAPPYVSAYGFLRNACATLFIVAALVFLNALPARAELAQGERGIVATVHPLATDAAINAFKRGGNAIDAAVAAALTLGVVDGHNSGIGGSCFML